MEYFYIYRFITFLQKEMLCSTFLALSIHLVIPKRGLAHL